MKKILTLFFIVLVGCAKMPIYKIGERHLNVPWHPIFTGTVPNDGTGDNLRVAFTQVNTTLAAQLDTNSNKYTKPQARKLWNDSINARLASTIYTRIATRNNTRDSLNARMAAAYSLPSLTFLKTDVNTSGNPIDLEYFNTYNVGGGGFDVDKVQWIVGTTAGAPANTDTSFTISQLASKEIKLYRGTTADLHLEYLNRTATNGKTGYRYNSSGVIVVRPAWATGDRAYVEGMPVVNSNWLTLSSAAAYFTETFEAAGYDNAVWSESVGSGSIVYEDETGITPPVGGGSQTLKIQKISPNYSARTDGTLAASQVVSYSTLYYYVSAQGLASTESMTIFSLFTASYGAGMASVSLYVDSYDSNNLKFICAINDDGTETSVGWPGAGSAVQLNTWYKFNILYDVTGDTYEVKITPAGGGTSTVMSGSLTASHPTGGLRIISLGNSVSSKTLTNYFDNVAVGTTAYPTF